jgi:purine/pyrimidine-nucleoside phosphorylase
MLKVNEYFNGKVKSIAFQTEDGNATVGVITPGEYEFRTVKPETMAITSGAMAVKLPDADWAEYATGQSFEVPGNARFRVRLESEVSYLCQYH